MNEYSHWLFQILSGWIWFLFEFHAHKESRRTNETSMGAFMMDSVRFFFIYFYNSVLFLSLSRSLSLSLLFLHSTVWRRSGDWKMFSFRVFDDKIPKTNKPNKVKFYFRENGTIKSINDDSKGNEHSRLWSQGIIQILYKRRWICSLHFQITLLVGTVQHSTCIHRSRYTYTLLKHYTIA